MARCPDTVRVNARTIDVLIDEASHNAAQVEEGASLFGRFDPSKQVITAAANLHPDTELDTVLHEVLHAVTHVYGLTADGAPLDHNEDGDEVVVAVLAPALIALLRDNPDLVAYILEPEGR